MKNYTDIINQNYVLEEGIFLHSLAEEWIFNEGLFWEYSNSVITLTKNNLDKEYDLKAVRKVVWTHNKIIKCFLFHHSKNDHYEMDNFPNETEHLFLERLDFIIDGFLGKYTFSEKAFGDEIRNPDF
ncbi:Imm41 family immunity protein [Bacillus sp. X1(2014)]|uniref:Imm41 family immunity protein n=1 Tax=Bacillus sp. X1(2014) TaxID=1565991 RepID=UPI0011A4E1A3|nr:Imm41 family immunity protein [Bacillus sp. X1(2014)]